jgi:hypothetical protein
VPSNDAQQLLELLAAQAKRTHVRSNEIFSEILVHLDDDRSGKARLGHYEMITFRSRFNAA